MANLVPVQVVFPTGLLQALVAAAAGGDVITNNNGRTTFLIVTNAHATLSRTLAFDDVGSTQPTGAQQFDPDVDVVVAALTTRLIGPFPTARFSTSVGVTYTDAAANLTVQAIFI